VVLIGADDVAVAEADGRGYSGSSSPTVQTVRRSPALRIRNVSAGGDACASSTPSIAATAMMKRLILPLLID